MRLSSLRRERSNWICRACFFSRAQYNVYTHISPQQVNVSLAQCIFTPCIPCTHTHIRPHLQPFFSFLFLLCGNILTSLSICNAHRKSEGKKKVYPCVLCIFISWHVDNLKTVNLSWLNLPKIKKGNSAAVPPVYSSSFHQDYVCVCVL